MIGASKILTVSYGTFSCTLEGFDDPFNTMRAIAEYFRDLAAEDRYFGAEPPTPDAAMLLKIAEREVQRRVEAKIQDNGVVLRTGDAMQAPSFIPTPQPQAPVFPAPVFQAPAFQAPVSIVAPRAEPGAQPGPMPDGVAAKLLRIRAAVANAELAEPRAEAPATPTPAQPILADYSEDQHADEISTTNTLTATFAPKANPADVVDAEVWGQPAFAAADVNPDEDPTPAARDLKAAEMLAEDPSFADQSPIDEAAHDEDLAEADLSAPQDGDPDDAPVPAASDADFAPSPDADDSLPASLGGGAASAPVAGQSDPAGDNDAADPEDYAISADEMDDASALDGDVVETITVFEAVVSFTLDNDDDYEDEVADIETREFHAASYADPEQDAATSDLTEATIDPVIEEIDSAYEPDLPRTSGPSEKALRARARVIKVRRDVVVEAAAALSAETPADAAASDVAAMLAADAEAELRRELRALQAQSAPAETTNQTDDETDEAGPEDDARQRLESAGEAAVSRLIEQTNEAMAVPENRRRLSAIAHLKAAVAATVADRFAKGGTAPKEAETKRLDPYREDLARVVRPQRPTGSDDAPTTLRPAPLVLVSAQRIDRPRPASGDTPPTLTAVPNSLVRPRRVTSAAIAVETAPEQDDDDEDIGAANVFSDTRGFAEFSERLGANNLAEILEAAAAYSVCIEGRPYFSRPQLMSQIGALSADSEYTREDGLRTFGALLREGRIQKIKRGQFVLTESSRYLSEARTLAG